MSDGPDEVSLDETSTAVDGGRVVTPLELFFDLVFVFAITQVTTLLTNEPTWTGMERGVLVLAMLWWAWSAYAWLTNTLDPDEGGVRIAVLAAIAALLVVSLAVPGAFGSNALMFAAAYIAVRVVHLVLFAIAGRGDRDLLGAVARLVPTVLLSGGLLIAAAFLDGSAQIACWIAAVVADYGGPLFGHMRGWRVSPDHFVERFGQFMLIALGESIVAIGLGAQGLALDTAVISSALLGMCVVACLWWSYFDWFIYVAVSRLTEMTGVARAALARDGYSYLHLPMVAGIVLFAFGVKTALHDPTDALAGVPAFALVFGIALYFMAHVALRLRIGGGWGRGRPIASVVLLAFLAVATLVPAIVALGFVAAVCVALITYEVVRHRESRRIIRSRHGTLTDEEIASVDRPRRERRNSQGG
jgi:low temperature requirement protein LtrA